MILFWIRKVALPHTLIHTGKRTDGDNGPKSIADLIFLEQKGPQLVAEDEAGGSNPPSSSKKTPEIFGFRVFFAAYFYFPMWGTCLPHTRKRNNGQKSSGQGPNLSATGLRIYPAVYRSSRRPSFLVLTLPSLPSSLARFLAPLCRRRSRKEPVPPRSPGQV